MPVSLHTQQFLDVFRLTEADLEENRRGRTSARQIQLSQRFWSLLQIAVTLGGALIAWILLQDNRTITGRFDVTPLLVWGPLVLVANIIAAIRKRQIATLPLKTSEGILEKHTVPARVGKTHYAILVNEDRRAIPVSIRALGIIVSGLRYRVYQVGLETVLIEPLEEPRVLPVLSAPLLSKGAGKILISITAWLFLVLFGLDSLESVLTSYTPMQQASSTPLPLQSAHQFTYGERIGHFQVSSIAKYSDYTVVGLSGLVTATGTLSVYGNGYAFVPDKETDVPFPPVPHTGFVSLGNDRLLSETIGVHGRWRASVQINYLELSLSSSGNQMRGRIVSVTGTERIPEAE